MSAKGTPAWDVARIDRTFAETFVLRSELLIASCSDGIVSYCHLVGRGSSSGPTPSGEAAYLHTTRGCDGHMRAGVSLRRADRGLPPCRANARVRQAAARLPPEPARACRAARIHPRRHFQSRLGSNLHRRTPGNSKSNVRSGIEVHVEWDGPVVFRSLCSPTAMSWLRERLSTCHAECAMVDRFLAALHGDDGRRHQQVRQFPMVPSLRVSR